ncbi:hypothetical protein V5O48_010838, partial [Marasmius crinis-equi]
AVGSSGDVPIDPKPNERVEPVALSYCLQQQEEIPTPFALSHPIGSQASGKVPTSSWPQISDPDQDRIKVENAYTVEDSRSNSNTAIYSSPIAEMPGEKANEGKKKAPSVMGQANHALRRLPSLPEKVG